jgi:hypothetical protein
MPYLLAYFRTPAEALHLAWSEDGLRWQPLNANQPILHATVGNASVRDPFLRYCADGWFHLLSTDSWHSPNILHTCTQDLLNWQPWDIVPIMSQVPETQNTWAPEFFYDAERQIYLLLWSSVTNPPQHQRIWYAETRDFRSYTVPSVLFDPGYSVIDATLVLKDGTYFLIYKDERGENRSGTDYKAMRVAMATHLHGPYIPQTGLITPPLTEGPALFYTGDRWLMLYDCFMESRWGAAESQDLLQWKPVHSVEVPSEARHGTVLALSPQQSLKLIKRDLIHVRPEALPFD